MALVKCAECGASVSSEAKACPSCGKQAPKPLGCCAISLVALVAAITYLVLSGTLTPK